MENNPQDALSAILSNPAALSAAMEMAKSFLGSQPSPPADAREQESTQPASEPQPASESQTQPQSSATAVPPLAALMGGDDEKSKLLLALRPFLSPKRSEKVGTVLALMRALQMMGGSSLFDFGRGS